MRTSAHFRRNSIQNTYLPQYPTPPTSPAASPRLRLLYSFFGYVIIPLLYASLILTFLPLSSAYALGPDEGYELYKAYLWSEGYALYSEIWNNMPPVHTAMLYSIFQFFGPSVYCARLLTVVLAVLLLISLFHIVRSYRSPGSGLVAQLLLCSAPLFLQLSVSAMLELPAFSLGLAAYALLLIAIPPASPQRLHTSAASPNTSPHAVRFISYSGIVFALAVHIKFTAALLLTPIGSHMLLFSHGSRPGLPGLRVATPFLIASLLTTAFIHCAIPGQSLSVLLLEHFHPAIRTSLAPTHTFALADLALAPAFLITAIVGALHAVFSRAVDGLIPTLYLLTLVVAHTHNVPYWEYYYLHFAIGFAWQISFIPFAARSLSLRVLFATLLVTIIADITIHAPTAYRRLHTSATIPVGLAANSPKTPLALFHSRQLSLPQLAINPKKRQILETTPPPPTVAP